LAVCAGVNRMTINAKVLTDIVMNDDVLYAGMRRTDEVPKS